MLFLLFLLLIPLAFFVRWVTRPMNIRRDPDSEGRQIGEAVLAYDRTSSWPIFVLERAVILREMRRNKVGEVIMDAGCGPGFLAAGVSQLFRDSIVVGLDINYAMLTIAKRRWPEGPFPNLSFLLGNVEDLPLSDGTIDFIVSSLSFHHWSKPEAGLREISRVLKPGGRFLIFDLRRDSPRYIFYFLKLGQIFSPKAIRETNGLAGSFRSSHTSSEIQKILNSLPFVNVEIKKNPIWLSVSGVK